MLPSDLFDLPCAYCGDSLGDEQIKVLHEDSEGTIDIAAHTQCWEAEQDADEHAEYEQRDKFPPEFYDPGYSTRVEIEDSEELE